MTEATLTAEQRAAEALGPIGGYLEQTGGGSYAARLDLGSGRYMLVTGAFGLCEAFALGQYQDNVLVGTIECLSSLEEVVATATALQAQYAGA